MATWGDVIGLIVVSTLFLGAIAAFVYVTEGAKKAAAEKDSELRAKGVTITGSGIAIKLDKQAPTKDELIESQSRAFLKGGEVLARPGVISAGKQASFRDTREKLPSAFRSTDGNDDVNGDEDNEKVRRRNRG